MHRFGEDDARLRRRLTAGALGTQTVRPVVPIAMPPIAWCPPKNTSSHTGGDIEEVSTKPIEFVSAPAKAQRGTQ